MQPTVFLIENLNNEHVKIVKRLAKELLRPKYNSKSTFFPNSFNQDLLCVIEIDGLKVGLMDHSSEDQSPSHLLDFFSNKACHLIFCSSSNFEDIFRELTTLHQSNHIRFSLFKKLLNLEKSSDLLNEIQVEKLIEIIHLFGQKNEQIERSHIPSNSPVSTLIA